MIYMAGGMHTLQDMNEHITSHGYTFSQHMALVKAWSIYNGQKGSQRQVSRLMDRMTAPDLARMLAARGIVVDGCTRVANLGPGAYRIV